MKIKLVNDNITSDYTKNLLRARGVDNIDDFLSPSEKNLQSWEDLDNIKLGVDLVKNTINDKKPYAILIDPDNDGFTSFAILYQYLKRLNPEKEIEYFVHSAKQHGLEDTYQVFQDKEYSVVFLPDSSSNDGVFAKEINAPICVIDHHEIDNEPSDNMIVINNQSSAKYKNKYLSGAGMVWQFCRAMDYYFGHEWAYDYTDLAAVGICGDAMSGLEIENQYIWSYGFSHINNFFLKTLIDKQNFSMKGIVNPTTVAFYISPLLNAVTRVGTTEEKLHMAEAFINGEKLIPSNKKGHKGELVALAAEATRECVNAKSRQARILDNIEEKIDIKINKEDLLINKVLFVELDDDDDFPSTLNGLLATRLTNKYSRPAIVARANDDGYIRGSARAIKTENMDSFKQYLEESEMFEYVLGHPLAFGCSISSYNLDKFFSYSNDSLKDVELGEKCYSVNFIRDAMDNDIDNLIRDVGEYGYIWSNQNDEPTLYIDNIILSTNEIQIIGTNRDTVKFIKNGITYIKFKANELIDELSGMKDIIMKIVGRCNINEWNGIKNPQIIIDDYEIIDNMYGF